MKNYLLPIVCFVNISCFAQQKLTYSTLKNITIEYLLEKKEITIDRALKYKSGEYNAYFFEGIYNGYKNQELINGLYSFGVLGSNSKLYYVLAENSYYHILDISEREGLDKSIKIVLDFCERHRYCVQITKEYVSTLVYTFYSMNKYTQNGHDVNCEKGFFDTKKLP